MEIRHPDGRRAKSQSAIEYLITHAWMLLIIAVVLAVLISLGVFNPNSIATSSCSLPAQFGCSVSTFSENGVAQLSVGQYMPGQITIVSVGCSSNQSTNYQNVEQQSLNTGNNASFTIQCYSGSSKFNGTIGSVYRGYLIVNYTDQASGFTHTISGPITAKVSTTS